jgi:esterase/lipase superfamily enzyme
MSQRTVFFATNRAAGSGKPADAGILFGTTPAAWEAELRAGTAWAEAAPDPSHYGRYHGCTLADADPDTSVVRTVAAWLAAAREADAVPLLLVHGFDFLFEEAVVWSADLMEWYARGAEDRGGAPRLVPLLFSFPSVGEIGLGQFKQDQARAKLSGAALARLIRAVDRAVTSTPPPRRPMLLAHSMGVLVTRRAVQDLAGPVGATPPKALFDQAFLMAGDDWHDAFDPPGGGGSEGKGALRPLAGIARFVTIGVHRGDGVVKWLSGTINGGERLGAAGPKTPAALPEGVAVVDYSYQGAAIGSAPKGSAEPNWVGHQYYRNSRAVRADILAAMAENGEPSGVSTRRAAKPQGMALDEIPGRLYLTAGPEHDWSVMTLEQRATLQAIGPDPALE